MTSTQATLSLAIAALALSLSSCARYQGHNGVEPYGYFSSRSDDGYLQVGYESWRPGSRERICGFAHRRVEELGLKSVPVRNEKWEELHEHTHVYGQTAYVRGSTHPSAASDGIVAFELSPDYVSARVIRRCVLTLEQPAD
mgnify:CR=1 FL=1